METKNKHARDAAEKTSETQTDPSEPVAEPAESAPISEEKTAEGAEAEKETSARESETERLTALAEDYKRKWYSVSAEYENYRKRTSAESARRYAEGRADVVKGLFPIGDNLYRALESCADEATKKGISMVVAAFENLLEEEKIETVDPVGEPFDPQVCEAIMAVDPAEGDESGAVKQVYRKGYLQNGKVLRCAQVVVVK